MEAADGLPILSFASDAEWRAWLERHHVTAAGVWISIAKKGTGVDSVRYPEVLEHAICFGWIDGRRERLDETASFSASRRAGRAARGRRSTARRRSGSTQEGLMAPAGHEEVRRAKEDGRWERAYALAARRRRCRRTCSAELDAQPGGRGRVRQA